MAKVAIFLAEGFEEIEALTVVDLLRRKGIEIQMVSVTGEYFVTSSHQITVKADALFDEMNYTDVDMLVLPGGMPGTLNLEKHIPLMNLLEKFYYSNKKIAAICAAPSILGHKGILKEKRACCYPGFEQDLAGANVTNNEVEVDGNVITSRGMGCAIPFGLAIVESFLGQEVSNSLKDAIIYQG